MNLSNLQKRIKGSRLYYAKNSGVERLYFPYKRNATQTKFNIWFEIVNDRITPFVKVYCPNQHENWETNIENELMEGILDQFSEIINDCELERRETPLDERLKDDVVPVSEGSMLHQAQALRFCCSMKVSALFADTGTGKTKIAVDLAASRYEAGQIKKVLIFCPVSTKKNFRDEIDKWYKGVDLEWNIVGLETMSSSEITVLRTLDWVDNETMIIIDESHNCKTPTAKRSKRILACCEKCSYKVIMTGTPAESVKDMYMQYAMLSQLIIGEPNWLKFEEKYLICDSRGDIIGYKNVDYLMGLLEPYTYQVRNEDVMDLPAKHFHTISCDLNYLQNDKYYELKEELLEKLDNFEKDEPVPATLIFRYFGKMQQVSCGFIKDDDGNITDLGTEKFNQLHCTGYDIGQTLFFCKYLWEVDKLTSFLGRDNCAVFTGENREIRDDEKDDFTVGKRKYFVATMGSGGTGLNGLQHASRIVFFSNSFKYTERKQCIGRIDRKGQVNEMEIYDMRPECGIEYRISNNLNRKGNLSEEIRVLLKKQSDIKNYVQEL